MAFPSKFGPPAPPTGSITPPQRQAPPPPQPAPQLPQPAPVAQPAERQYAYMGTLPDCRSLALDLVRLVVGRDMVHDVADKLMDIDEAWRALQPRETPQQAAQRTTLFTPAPNQSAPSAPSAAEVGFQTWNAWKARAGLASVSDLNEQIDHVNKVIVELHRLDVQRVSPLEWTSYDKRLETLETGYDKFAEQIRALNARLDKLDGKKVPEPLS